MWRGRASKKPCGPKRTYTGDIPSGNLKHGSVHFWYQLLAHPWDVSAVESNGYLVIMVSLELVVVMLVVVIRAESGYSSSPWAF